MSRLEPVTAHDLDPARQELWDRIVGTRGAVAVGPDGGLIGPFNAFVQAAETGRHLSALGHHLRVGLSIERRLIEVAICTVGAAWRSEFEFWAHRPMAVEHGVAPEVLKALRLGRVPEFERDDEATVHAVAAALVADGRVDDELYRRAESLLGPTGLVELVSLVGYYCLISLMLNFFEVEVPGDEDPVFT